MSRTRGTRAGAGAGAEEGRPDEPGKGRLGFFVVLGATLIFGFCIGDIDDPDLDNPDELFAAAVVDLIATMLKFGEQTEIGAVHFATSLVAELQPFVPPPRTPACALSTILLVEAVVGYALTGPRGPSTCTWRKLKPNLQPSH